MCKYTTLIFNIEPSPTITFTVSNQDLKDSQLIEKSLQEIDHIFSTHSIISEIYFESEIPSQLVQSLPSLYQNRLSREGFYQQVEPWHLHSPSTLFPWREVQTLLQYRHHPLRPEMPKGRVYQRHDHNIDAEISFRVFDLEKDLERFTAWMNDPRVANFWEQAWSYEKLAEFIKERLDDPHIIPLIGEFNGEPFGYVEAYWVSEDRLSPYYDVQPYDRGIHLLVGEQAFRGPEYFNCWMRAISHYLFIDEVRTQRIVLEPRADNHRLFNRIQEVGYKKCFEFNFPHKRSALMMIKRQAFFSEQW
ncbi:GNAT family N-acetyltransferase [Aliivibrio fischeri]|uniref:GNAT family N-acetyltransferase n=1 Tax=Aliivibrio fischeri TaxID=668 RepID=UPI0007C565B3|nr:GNAT family N-acetyltransferase [Aliivibrio fischeri]TDM52146.1 N-acetyltransferase [Aliivibrio fischeri]